MGIILKLCNLKETFGPPMRSTTRPNLLHLLYDALEAAFGPMSWWPATADSSSPHGGVATPFEVCIGAILTQNAPWTGVTKAIRALKDLGIFSAEGIVSADERTIAEAIRPTIYHNRKTRRLKVFCDFLLEGCGGRIETLKNLDPDEARLRLLAVPGIGFETADSILLYALGMPVFVVDAYTKRIALRHGLVSEECEYEELRSLFERALDPDPSLYNEFHALLCHLGATHCRRKPDCGRCPARAILGEPAL